ncbi:MAG TPA: ATP-binding protein, partial [Planctomycetota bacterium]|nr:ATP-binding protein [Planctomycetota bacterium]
AVDDMAEHLGASRSRLEALIDGFPYGVLLVAGGERDRRVEYVNGAFERVTGFARGEAIGRPAEEFLPRAEALGAAVFTARARGRRKDGASYEQEVTVAPLAGGAGAAGARERSWVGVIRDVTQEVQLEELFRQAQKMEAVGRLAGGVAHDFNNLLTAIQGYASLAAQVAGDRPDIAEALEEIRQAADRAAALTTQLLAFSRKQVIQPKVIDLNTVISSMAKMLNRLLGEDVDLALGLGRALDPVRADPGQVQQVVMNLAVNARDAMPEGGKLAIATANVSLDAAAATPLGLRAGPHVELAVTDTGTGMDEATRRHLFEPFFTTKEAGRGTGLGLSTVYGIVKQSQGGIAVETAPGRGTTFRVYLPRVDEALTARPGSDSDPTRLRGSETVLVVEDEEVVRRLARRSLEQAGYRVLEAGRGQDALDLAARHAGAIDILVTDMIMPGMSGRQLAERLAAARPGLRILFMSGHTEQSPLDGAPGSAFLQKPFTPSDLASRVREVLDAPAR